MLSLQILVFSIKFYSDVSHNFENFFILLILQASSHFKNWLQDKLIDASCSLFPVDDSCFVIHFFLSALATRESERVVFPWSTCAMTDIFRMDSGFLMISSIWSIVKLGIPLIIITHLIGVLIRGLPNQRIKIINIH